MKHKIHQLMMYLGTNRSEGRLFHSSADFAFHALAALEKLMNAMELLQPLSMREYGSEFGRSIPAYGGDVRRQHILACRDLDLNDDVRDEFDERIWAKLKLDVPGRIREQHQAAWSAVFDFVEQKWREDDVEVAILSRVLNLRPKAKPGPAKDDAEGDAQNPSLPSTNAEKLPKEEQGGPPKPIQQQGITVQGTSPEVKQSAATARPTRETPSRPKTTYISELERSFSEFQFVDKPPKPSMFPEEITWAEKQSRRSKNDAGKEGFGRTENADSPQAARIDVHSEPDAVATSKIVFADAKVYKSWRTIFPLPAKGESGGRLKWEDLCSLLTSPPLNFRISADGGTTLRFHRDKSGGWPGGVVTIHKGHGLNPKMTKFELDNVKKDLRKEFGWTAEDFELAS